MKRCYDCGHEGELTGPPFSNLCVDRDACYARHLENRTRVWEDHGACVGRCAWCGAEGAVMFDPPQCVDDRGCNERRGGCSHHPDWRMVGGYCMACGERVAA